MNFRHHKFLLILVSLIVIFPATIALCEVESQVSKTKFEKKTNIQYKYLDTIAPKNYLNSLLFVSSNKKATPELFNKSSLIAEVASFFNNHSDVIKYVDVALMAADSLQYNFEDKKMLFLIKSNALENLNSLNESLDLWRGILKHGEDLEDINISYYAFYNLIRIYNNQSNHERARIYADALIADRIFQVSNNLSHLIQIELIKLFIQERNTEEAKNIFYKLYDGAFSSPEITEVSTFLNLFMFAKILVVNDQLIEDLAVILEEKSHSDVSLDSKKDIAFQMGYHFAEINSDKAAKYFLLAEKIAQETFRKKLDFVTFTSNPEYIIASNPAFSSSPNNSKFSNALLSLALLVLALIILAVFLLNRNKSIRKKFDHKMINFAEEKQELTNKINHLDSDIENQINDRIETLKNEILERERIDEELKDALQKAEKANYLKNAFLGNMSHEIRTPLNGILGFSSLLETELALLENPDLYEYANSIQKSGERLLHLLNNIIDISRLEANDIEMNITACELSEIITQVCEVNKSIANDKGIKIVNDIRPSFIAADRPTLTRVLNEIVDNAIKYTEKGFIKISILEDTDRKKVSIIVKDSGIGIDSNYLPHIFEAFRQESLGYTRQYQGAGLGIPLAKRLIDKMGGHFKIASEKTIGTEVRIDFPIYDGINKESEKIKKDTDSIENVLKGKRVLIVEDDPASRTILVKLMKRYATVVEAKDGEEALQTVLENYKNQQYFDLMLLDINLPAPWDGIKLLKSIKDQIDNYQNVPFIAQTAYGMDGDKNRILEAGFVGYVSKPIHRKQLFDEIINVFEKK